MSDTKLSPTRVVPINFGPMRDASGNARIKGICGDTMEFWIAVEQGKIDYCTYTTDGCIHSILCGSAAAALALGKTPEEARTISQEAVLKAAGNIPDESQHCALLAVKTLSAAVADHLSQEKEKEILETSPKKPQESRPQETEESVKIKNRLSKIRNKIIVLSGKGGVGKSTVAVNTAATLALKGFRVGLLDADIHGPSVPTMLNLKGEKLAYSEGSIYPLEIGNLKIISLGFFLQNQDDAVIWRGPLKMGVLKQFIGDVEWGELDYLIIDSPPGTGDEPLSIIQILGNPDGALVVTTPQEVAAADVRKSINFCRQLKVPVLGIVENMSGFACPHCGTVTEIFNSGGGKKMAEDFQVPFLGSIPLDPDIVKAGDSGTPFIEGFYASPSAEFFSRIVEPLLDLQERKE